MQAKIASGSGEFILNCMNHVYPLPIAACFSPNLEYLKNALPSAISALAGLPWPVVLFLLLFLFGARPAKDWIETLNTWHRRDRGRTTQRMAAEQSDALQDAPRESKAA
jgi:hypothetical protein